jgi:hypothetical protein
MDGSVLVAAYAAVVSTASALWQVLLWRTDRQGRLTVALDAYWSQDQEEIKVSITNRNSYEVTLAGGNLFLKDMHGYGDSFPLDLRYLNLPTALPPRSTVEWVIDRDLMLEKLVVSLAKVIPWRPSFGRASDGANRPGAR